MTNTYHPLGKKGFDNLCGTIAELKGIADFIEKEKYPSVYVSISIACERLDRIAKHMAVYRWQSLAKREGFLYTIPVEQAIVDLFNDAVDNLYTACELLPNIDKFKHVKSRIAERTRDIENLV